MESITLYQPPVAPNARAPRLQTSATSARRDPHVPDVLITGHSLGGGVAALLAALWRAPGRVGPCGGSMVGSPRGSPGVPWEAMDGLVDVNVG